jgi:hypothetical protein
MRVKSPETGKGRLHKAFALSLLACLLFVVTVSPVSAQQGSASTPGGAVKRLLEASETRKHAVATFEEFATRYEEHWPEGVIAGYKAKGLFKSLSPEQTAQMENLIREFSKNLFKGIKNRVGQEILTVDNLQAISGEPFGANLTEREIDELTAFCETSAGKKFVKLYWEVATKLLISDLEAKGMFAPLPSPKEEEAKIDRIFRELAHSPPIKDEVQAALKVALVKDLTAGELKELAAFSETPLSGKLAAASPKLAAEIIANSGRLFAPRARAITAAVFAEQMELFAAGVRDIFNHGKPASGSKTPDN